MDETLSFSLLLTFLTTMIPQYWIYFKGEIWNFFRKFRICRGFLAIPSRVDMCNCGGKKGLVRFCDARKCHWPGILGRPMAIIFLDIFPVLQSFGNFYVESAIKVRGFRLFCRYFVPCLLSIFFVGTGMTILPLPAS